jgi:uncharacterized phage protein (predicted DNA packaging)
MIEPSNEPLLPKIKEFLRIDGGEEDLFLSSLILASKAYIKNATGVNVIDTDNLHILAVSLLVAHSYENRLPMGKGETLPFSLESILVQIKYCPTE